MKYKVRQIEAARELEMTVPAFKYQAKINGFEKFKFRGGIFYNRKDINKLKQMRKIS